MDEIFSDRAFSTCTARPGPAPKKTAKPSTAMRTYVEYEAQGMPKTASEQMSGWTARCGAPAARTTAPRYAWTWSGSK